MTKITTHVLDISLGKPAELVKITLAEQNAAKILAEGITNREGRILPSLYEGILSPGVYCLFFSLTHYFALSQRESLYPFVVVHFMLAKNEEHFHLPLLISPAGYSTYRGC